MRASTLLALCLVACVPNVDVDESVITQPRVLAIRATPAESPPGASVSFEALYVDAAGRIVDAPLEWAFCTARRPLAELGPVSHECLTWTSEELHVLGSANEATGTVPMDACRLFGPDPPPAEPGQPTGRVVAPDPTGGYFLPVRVVEPDDDAFVLGSLRLACGTAGADQATSAELRRRYRGNESPSIESIVIVRADGSEETIGEDAPLVLAIGERVVVRAAWPECPETPVCGDGVCDVDETRELCADDCTTPRGCGGAERFVRYDAASEAIVTQREGMRLAFTTTIGRFETERVGRTSDDRERTGESALIAPDAPGTGSVFVIARDERGAASWRELHIAVR